MAEEPTAVVAPGIGAPPPAAADSSDQVVTTGAAAQNSVQTPALVPEHQQQCDTGEEMLEEGGESSPGGPGAKACAAGVIIGYGAGAAVDLHTGSIVFSDKGTLNSDTYQWLLAEEENQARHKPCPASCYTGLCVAKCYSITLGLALVSLIITVVMTVSSIPKIRAYQFAAPFTVGNCSTVEAAYGGDWEPCECDQRRSSFPCVQVYVNLNGNFSSGNDTSSSSSYLLRSNEFDLLEGLQCSYKPPCNCDKEVNREKVVHFIKVYRHPGTSFSCLYNPVRISEIIRERTPNEAFQWAKVLLPSIAFLLCLVTLLVVLILRKQNVWTVIKAEDKLQTQG